MKYSSYPHFTLEETGDLNSFPKYFPGGSEVKASACVCLQCGRAGLDPWVGKIPWRRKWQPTPVFLAGESHGWRSLVGYSPWGRKQSDTTEQLTLSLNAIAFLSASRLMACVSVSLTEPCARGKHTEHYLSFLCPHSCTLRGWQWACDECLPQ